MVQEIRCSKLHRTMNCLGYNHLTNLQETEAGEPAREGTAVGELLSEMIRQGTSNPKVNSAASNGFLFNQEMWFYARDTYQTLCETSKGQKIETEERIDWMTESGIKIRGSFDISYTVDRTLHIEDLKYGWVIVDVKENWQLLGYAIGQMKRLHAAQGFVPSHIHFKIHQPRAHHEDGSIRSWVVDYAELLVYWKKIEDRMRGLVSGDKTLKTSSSCNYCEGVTEGKCPAFSRAFYNTIDVALKEWNQDVLDNDTVAKQVELLTRAEEILKIKKKSLDQLAITRITNGQVIPGYTIEQTHGDRQWIGDVSVKSIKTLTGVDISKNDMLSPAQAEKMGVPKKLVAQLITRPHRGTKLIKKDTAGQAEKILPQPMKQGT